ncbi:hypothetical protein GE21DRAFT_1113220 [Neurospora crassa]|nr:hypothetical protein GE21DRAFT_1113220 [Neurospora crassa]
MGIHRVKEECRGLVRYGQGGKGTLFRKTRVMPEKRGNPLVSVVLLLDCLNELLFTPKGRGLSVFIYLSYCLFACVLL